MKKGVVVGARQAAKAEGRQATNELRLARALAHPLRLKILAELNRREASPSEMASDWKQEVAGVAYHARVLEKAGMAEIVKTEAIRGSVKHTFRATRRTAYPPKAWEAIPASARSEFTNFGLEALAGRVSRAIAADTFDSKINRHLNVSTFEVDDVAWEEIDSLYEGLHTAMLEIEEKAKNRAATEGGDGDRFWATVSFLSFESPHFE